MVTITLPRFSGRAAKRTATATLAPVLIPPRMPSSCDRRRAQLKASSLATVSAPESKLRIQILGNETGPNALDLVRAGLAAGNHGRVGRLDRHRFEVRLVATDIAGRAGDRAARAHPGQEEVDVCRPCPPKSRGQWSARESAGLEGLSNCWGIQLSGVGRGQFLGLGDGPVHAVLGRREHQLGPQGLQQRAALERS